MGHLSWAGSQDLQTNVRSVATLPMRMGGLGLRCAERIRANLSWADALSMIHHRNPSIEVVVERLDNGALEGCLEEFAVHEEMGRRGVLVETEPEAAPCGWQATSGGRWW